jgi:hypothetical protein
MASQSFVGAGGAVRVPPSSRQRVLTSAPAHRRVTPLSGLRTVSVHRLQPGLQWWVLVTVWVPAVVVSRLVATGFDAVVDYDIAVTWGGSGCGTRGWRLGCGAIGWFGCECRRLRGVCGCFEAGEEVVVVDVDDIDGG